MELGNKDTIVIPTEVNLGNGIFLEDVKDMELLKEIISQFTPKGRKETGDSGTSPRP